MLAAHLWLQKQCWFWYSVISVIPHPFQRHKLLLCFHLKIKSEPSQIPSLSCYSVSSAICWSDFAVTCDLQAVSGRIHSAQTSLGLFALTNWTAAHHMGRLQYTIKTLETLLFSSYGFLCLVLKPPGGSWEAGAPSACGWERVVLYFFEVPICSDISTCQIYFLLMINGLTLYHFYFRLIMITPFLLQVSLFLSQWVLSVCRRDGLCGCSDVGLLDEFICNSSRVLLITEMQLSWKTLKSI